MGLPKTRKGKAAAVLAALVVIATLYKGGSIFLENHHLKNLSSAEAAVRERAVSFLSSRPKKRIVVAIVQGESLSPGRATQIDRTGTEVLVGMGDEAIDIIIDFAFPQRPSWLEWCFVQINARFHTPDRSRASLALARIGQPAVPRLVELFNSTDWEKRKFAARALGAADTPRARQLAAEAARGGDHTVAHSAISGLGRAWSDETLAILVECTQHADPYRRILAIQALWPRGGAERLRAIVACLDDADETVKGFAVMAMGYIGDERSVALLVKMLADESSNIRFTVVTSLCNMKSPEVFDALVEALGDRTSPMRRRWAAKALGDFGDKRAIEPLRELLASTYTPDDDEAGAVVPPGLAEDMASLEAFLDSAPAGSLEDDGLRRASQLRTIRLVALDALKKLMAPDEYEKLYREPRERSSGDEAAGKTSPP